MSKPVILWLRNDLRVADNPALVAAVDTGQPVIALYIFDDPHMGGASKWWLHHSLEDLGKKIDLTIREGDSLKILQEIINDTGAEAVFWNRLYEPNAIERDTKIKKTLKDGGIDAQSFKGNVLFEPWEIKPYKVFTPYYKTCLANDQMIGAPVRTPKKMLFKKLKSDKLDLLPKIKWDKGFYDFWEPGQDGGYERASYFIDDLMSRYKGDRDVPKKDATSRMSPYLHFGNVSVRELWHRAGPHTGSAAFLRQLVWREFSIQLLYNNPKMPTQPLQEKFAKFPWQPNKKHLHAWRRGMTGYPIVDAGMRQLWQTGWMHNRVRMVVASFLVKHLLQPWVDGEQWFWDTLVDADLANNSVSWQWVAGCGADAAPYFRVFNPILQGEKFDPTGAYVRTFCPELKDVPDKFVHKPWESGMKLDYPAPIIEHSLGRTRALEALAKMKNN